MLSLPERSGGLLLCFEVLFCSGAQGETSGTKRSRIFCKQLAVSGLQFPGGAKRSNLFVRKFSCKIWLNY